MSAATRTTGPAEHRIQRAMTDTGRAEKAGRVL
jgi:hypothetical protein